MHLVDISQLGNGIKSSAYGGYLRAYSFREYELFAWYTDFNEKIKSAVETRTYLPVVRLGDGELNLLYPLLSLKRPRSAKNILENGMAVLRYFGIMGFKTSWGEFYPPSQVLKFRLGYRMLIRRFAKEGLLCIYWNENGLDAFTQHNKRIYNTFLRDSILLSADNYFPFHFPLALLTSPASQLLLKNRRLLFVSSIDKEEQQRVVRFLSALGSAKIDFLQISSSSAYLQQCNPRDHDYDLVFVSAGIASLSIIYQLRHLKCPCIDIGGMIHVISGVKSGYHGNFFVHPR